MKESATPASDHLFAVNENQEKLDKDMTEDFHHVVAQLPYLCERARLDIQTAIAF